MKQRTVLAGNKLINNTSEHLKQIFSQYNSTERENRKTQWYFIYTQQHAKNDTWKQDICPQESYTHGINNLRHERPWYLKQWLWNHVTSMRADGSRKLLYMIKTRVPFGIRKATNSYRIKAPCKAKHIKSPYDMSITNFERTAKGLLITNSE